MNIVRRVSVLVHARALEWLLGLATIILLAQLSWPVITSWWNNPRPGRVGFDQIESPTLGREFVIRLPAEYGNGKSWPLVVFLHGSGDRGNDPRMLRDRGPLRLKLPAIVTAPQSLPPYSWEPTSIAAFVEQVASRYNVDRNRIYLIGYSMGGYGVWRTAAAHAELFAAIVPICGGAEPSDAKLLAKIPIWAFHGAEDEVIPPKETEEMIAAIRKSGGQPRLTIIPNAGHGINSAVCERTELWEWLFQQRRDK